MEESCTGFFFFTTVPVCRGGHFPLPSLQGVYVFAALIQFHQFAQANFGEPVSRVVRIQLFVGSCSKANFSNFSIDLSWCPANTIYFLHAFPRPHDSRFLPHAVPLLRERNQVRSAKPLPLHMAPSPRAPRGGAWVGGAEGRHGPFEAESRGL